MSLPNKVYKSQKNKFSDKLEEKNFKNKGGESCLKMIVK